MAKTVLLLLVVLGIGRSSGHFTPRDSPPSYRNWPCPNPDAISPCICTTDADHNLDMDCSAVVSTDQLENVFQAPFPYLDFRFLTITPTEPSYYLDIIRSGVFGLVTFQHIYITGTYIEKIEEAAFVNSRERLLTLDVNNNRIEDFPFGTVPQYIYLWYLNLAGNDLPVLPDLVSDSVRVLHLERNLGLSVSETTFVQVRLLEMLYLQDMSLGNIPPNVFSQLNVIRTINLDNNNYAGQLEQDTLNVPLDSLEVLHLRGNAITNIHPASITGLARAATVDFRNNNIKLLEKNSWFNLLEQVTQDDAIDLRENDLLCGCDVFWLVLSDSLMRKIHRDTKCRGNGPRLHDLPLDFFIVNC